MRRIIVNADDFGINEVVTLEIEQQIKSRRVTSTTIMANGACLDEVRTFSKKYPEVSFGVHLCLSEFDSLTKSEGLKNAGITDENGSFIHKAVFGLKNLTKPTVKKAIKDELNAQIDMVEGLGFSISHADSHHHVHTIFQLKELFTEVLHHRGIKKIRLGGDFRSLRMKLHLQLWIKRNLLNKYYRNEFMTSNDFYSYAEFLASGMPIMDGETIELMCHPGHPGTKYQEEIRRMEQTTFSNEIKLISYNEL